MNELERLRRNTEEAYGVALNSLLDLLNAITAERDYYRNLCEEKEVRELLKNANDYDGQKN